MRRYLLVTYSQSGQTARAAEVFASNLPDREEISIERLDLAADEAVKGAYRHPWGFFDFLRAQPEAFNPSLDIRAAREVKLDRFDAIVIAYPVWFLSPATPVSSFLRGLPPGSLSGKPVVTVATCRNMWFEAQRMMRALIEEKGGHVIAHAVLEDRAPSYATLVTTPTFFLTGRKELASDLLRRIFPPFGITDDEFERLADWARTFPATGAGDPPCMLRFRTPLALAELIGRKISRAIYLPWPFLASRSEAAQKAYLAFAAISTVAGIITLMPPAAVIGKTPPVKRLLERLKHESISRRRARMRTLPRPEPNGGT